VSVAELLSVLSSVVSAGAVTVAVLTNVPMPAGVPGASVPITV
jgi:hypothetical protein